MSTIQTATPCKVLESRIRSVLDAIDVPYEHIYTNVHYAGIEFKTSVIDSKTIDHILDQFDRPARIWTISKVGGKLSIDFTED